jgi:pimeloyl-ACP methyl ester carboxylesterase
MSEVAARPRRGPLWLVTVGVAISMAIGAGAMLVAGFVGPAERPFDLHSVGIACADDPAWVCGSISVPLDRSVRHSTSINVRFRVLPRRLATKASAGTVVVVNGGPGDSSMRQFEWAERAFESLHADHDLLLVDNRGSGASNRIDCRQLQAGLTPAALGACRTLLGGDVDNYSTVAAADDLAAVLTRIDSPGAELYGESYGTFFAQVFALRHPMRLRRLVLDGALPLNADPWRRDSLPAGLAGLRTTCRVDPNCRAIGDPVALIARALKTLRVGTGPEEATAGGADLASLVANAGRGGSAYRELPAALRAYLSGYRRPLYRLLHEAVWGTSGPAPSSATSDSVGLQVAVDCADEPQPFDLRAPLAVQKRELLDSYQRVASTSASAFLPFTPQETLRYAGTCLGWPAPTHATPQDLGTNFPNVPTLVLEGTLDTVTTSTGARSVAKEFRSGSYVEVPFVGHITALTDASGCAASIAENFLATTAVVTTCLAHMAAPQHVNTFPETFAEEPEITPTHGAGAAELNPSDRRYVGIVRDAISDVIWRWHRLGETYELGLWGGTAIQARSPNAPGRYRIQLDKFRWTSDTSVSGNVDVNLQFARGIDSMNATLRVSTPAGVSNFDIHSEHVLGASTVETITKVGRGSDAFSITVDANLGA